MAGNPSSQSSHAQIQRQTAPEVKSSDGYTQLKTQIDECDKNLALILLKSLACGYLSQGDLWDSRSEIEVLRGLATHYKIPIKIKTGFHDFFYALCLVSLFVFGIFGTLWGFPVDIFFWSPLLPLFGTIAAIAFVACIAFLVAGHLIYRKWYLPTVLREISEFKTLADLQTDCEREMQQRCVIFAKLIDIQDISNALNSSPLSVFALNEMAHLLQIDNLASSSQTKINSMMFIMLAYHLEKFLEVNGNDLDANHRNVPNYMNLVKQIARFMERLNALKKLDQTTHKDIIFAVLILTGKFELRISKLDLGLFTFNGPLAAGQPPMAMKEVKHSVDVGSRDAAPAEEKGEPDGSMVTPASAPSFSPSTSASAQ